MSSQKGLHSPSPANSSIRDLNHSRRPSTASHLSKGTTDHDVSHHTLDQIHTTASRTDTLTTFDFPSPPRPTSNEAKTATDVVQSGLSQLYSRFKATVGATRDPVPASPVNDPPDDASLFGGKPKQLPLTTPPSPSSSRIQSPAAPTFALATQSNHSLPQSPHADQLSPTNPPPTSAIRTQSPAAIAHDASHPRSGKRSRKPSEVSRNLPSGTPEENSNNKNTSPRPLGRLEEPKKYAPSSVSPSRQARHDPDSAVLPPFKFPEGGRPPMVQVGQSHLPGFQVSRETSIDGDYSSAASHGNNNNNNNRQTVHDTSKSTNEISLPHPSSADDASARFKNKVLAKELWMRDETANECFYCGQPFSTFRRKHHCRICGNIFDRKCTNLVDGKLFAQSGSLRICRPCEAIVYGTEDDSSVFSEDADKASYLGRSTSPRPAFDDNINMAAPSLGIPFARKTGESKRGAAIIEFTNERSLARPSSSRSLKSLSGLHRAAAHKRHHSRQAHQHMKSLKPHHDDRAPFQRDAESTEKASLPALHYDNIFDPDLAPFMSDDDPSEDETMSIFATLNNEAQSPSKDNDKAGLTALMNSTRRKGWPGDRATSVVSRDADNISLLGRSMSRRRRNVSVSSFYHPARPSPRRTKSNSLLKGFSVPGFGASPSILAKPLIPSSINEGSKMIRSSSMRGSSAPAVELNQASLHHVRDMLKQMLHDAQIPDSKRWEKALMPILLQCTDDVNPDIHRSDDIDIRHYVKLKKIPGAKPGDTSYVSGVVFTKNLALKSMPRSISAPRILIVTFPIEYARHHSQFMSLAPVIAQEREYLSNLIKRIVALNPQVLLVEKKVSGLALELLEQAGIAVIYNVKPSVLNAVSRCTQTNLISSVDKLALDPSEMGSCASFDVRTYVHGSMKKTYTYFSGCPKDLGCTIVLRGADMPDLGKLKRITEFMCYVVYNLKLETCVMRDEYVLIPARTSGGTLSSSKDGITQASSGTLSGPSSADTSQNLAKSGSTASNTHTSSSHVHSHDAPGDESTIAVSTQAASSTTKVPSENDPLNESMPSSAPSFYSNIVEEHKTKIISSSPFVKFMQPYLLAQAREQEAKLAELKKLRDQYSFHQNAEKDDESNEDFELVQPEMVHKLVKKPSKAVRDFLFAVHDAEYETAMHAYQTQKRQWEAYLSNNPTMFDPFNHQRIACLYSMVNSKTNPCVGPEMIALSFYNEHDLEDDFLPDITLGQYVEELCQSGDAPCSANDCNDNMFKHHRQYVHGDGQMSVSIQPYPSRIRGMQKTILMWSVCRICSQETQVMPMSESTWKYSFGKYLELTFWSTPLHARAHACPHDIHRNHVRFIGFNNVAVRLQYDAVQLYEIIVPRPTITWKVDKDIMNKNMQYLRFKGRLDRFLKSVKVRIESIHVDSMPSEKLDTCRAEVDRLTKLVRDDHERLTRKLQEKYMGSRWYEVIPLNRAARAIHENSLQWDEIFAKFERDFFPSEKDIRRMTALQLKKLFESATSFTAIDEAPEEEPGLKEKIATPVAEVPPEMTRRISIMSPEDTENVLASVIQDELSESPTEMQSAEPQEASQECVTHHDVTDHADVKHLDLAVTSSSSSPVEERKLKSASSPVLDNSAASTISNSLEISPQVSSTIDKMRASSDLEHDSPPDANMIEISAQESRIPRPIDSIRRLGVLAAPPLSRAQSQPQPSGLMKALPMSHDSKGEGSSAFPLRRTEKLRNLLADPARAFERSMTSRSFSRSGKQPHSMIPRSIQGKKTVFNLASHYEQLTREFEKQRQRDRRLREARGAYPLASSKPVVEVYSDAQEAVKETDSVDEPDNSTIGRASVDASRLDDWSVKGSVSQDDSQTSDTNKTKADNTEDPPMASQTPEAGESAESGEADQSVVDQDVEDTSVLEPDTTQASPSDSQLDLTQLKEEKVSVLKMLTNFWGERSSSGWNPLEYPFAAGEHVWGDSDIVIREDEPSSIIALTLSSADYVAKLRSFRKLPEDATAQDIDKSIERNLLHSKNTNIRYAFQNRGVRAQCKIFYAESFDALRRKCGVHERFVESLSRCLKWDSKGGKTKSLFLKTLDDRFVLKSLSAVEVNSFFKFAPDYFVFAHAMLFNGLPSVIAKMLGLFQVVIRNQSTGIEFNWFMIVMENLFYDREPNRRFDLKGSMRNRKIQSTGERDEVLLDENLVDIIFEKPIFVREHTMKLLTASVWNDTLFLSKQNVMDYSLMAGFDDDMKEIVVGIIDCIRTYTWDKKLETWIKDRGKNKPTVTSPKDYRNRFRVAMSKYILQAPNCWHQFQAQQIQGRPVRLAGRTRDEEVMASFDGRDAGPLGIAVVEK